ncbi:Mitochondrial import inner membrane translocase subunit Tim17-A [Chytridiales sp. JEL 0842]|nr:Mitochondrial import inner membrane translocase subunit Tim17-A [Chytridiales sp. JEL 0842]
MTRHDISDTSRDPCPYVIVYDVGVGFAMGSIGGSIWHAFKGYRNSPRGDRLVGTLSAVKSRAPVIGGNFAVWSGLFNAGDCALVSIRGKEDSWNAIMSGAATGGILAARSGPKAIAISAAFGGIILAVMEGVGAMIGKMTSETYKNVPPPLPDLPEAQPSPPSAPSAQASSPQTANTTAAAAPAPQQTLTDAQPPKPKSRFGFGFQ